MNMASFDLPIPLSDIETILTWVDAFKLSRPTKKINRDFSDAVLLAEILNVHYPKLVEMHNYPPRNSHSLKLNNWMTLNRKVLKKLKLNLCCNTMEQLANCASGVIERVLIMVRDKIARDEESNKTLKDAEQNVSSGGSYYEACGDDENVLVVPVKARFNGVLETVQQKVVNYESYLTLKEELKDAKDSTELLKQKVEHLDSMLKLKEERIDELQKQLDRKQARRKEVEVYQNNLTVPFDSVPLSPSSNLLDNTIIPLVKSNSDKTIECNKIPKLKEFSTKIGIEEDLYHKELKIEGIFSKELKLDDVKNKLGKLEEFNKATRESKLDESKIPIFVTGLVKSSSKPSVKEAIVTEIDQNKLDEKNKTKVFKEIEIIEQKSECFYDVDEFNNGEQNSVLTIEQTIQKELKDITKPIEFLNDFSIVN